MSGYSPPPECLDLSPLKVLRSLQVGNWITPFKDADAIMQNFSTLTSPVFAELVIICWYDQFIHFLLDATSIETLRVMGTVRPFRLVFLLNVFDNLSKEVGQTLDSALRLDVTKGLFDFLDFPPVICFE